MEVVTEPNLLSDNDCKEIISILAKKLCVRPKLITARLLSDNDKYDMRLGLLPIEALECHIRAWVASGMPDYAYGNTIPLDLELKEVVNCTNNPHEIPKELHYSKPFGDVDGKPITPSCN